MNFLAFLISARNVSLSTDGSTAARDPAASDGPPFDFADAAGGPGAGVDGGTAARRSSTAFTVAARLAAAGVGSAATDLGGPGAGGFATPDLEVGPAGASVSSFWIRSVSGTSLRRWIQRSSAISR